MNRKNVEDLYPLSPLQQGMLFHTLYSPESGAYVEQTVTRLWGDVRPEEMRRAWQLMVDRHTALRTAFLWEGVPQPVQAVLRQATLPFAFHDWSHLPADQSDARLRALLEEDRREAFVLSRAPLVRVALVRTGETDYRMILSFHHVILDGWSLSIVRGEALAAYAAFLDGAEPQLPPRRPFREYIGWLAKRDAGASEKFWRGRLAGFTAPTPVPMDRAPARAGAAPETYGQDKGIVPPELIESLSAAARRHHVTLNTLLHAAWAALLARWTGEDDVVFGTVVSGRPPELPDVGGVVGMFLNTLPVRIAVDRAAPVVEWLASIQARAGEAARYEHAPLADVQRWSEVGGAAPLFETLFVLENHPHDASAGEVQADPRHPRIVGLEMAQRTNYALTVTASPAGFGLVLSATFDAERLDAERARALLVGFEAILIQMATGEAATVADLDPLREEERRRVTADWNATAVEIPRASVHRLFADQAARTPDAVALRVDAGPPISYARLDARANRIARRLRALGIGPESRVGVSMERSADLVAALLGILKAGGAYVPLDPSYPAARLDFMRRDAEVRVVLTDGAGSIAEWIGDARVVSLAEERAEIDAESAEDLGIEVDPEGLAYVIYTSGSTGEPKGTGVPHRAVVRLVRGQEYASFGADEVFLQLAPVAFDASTFELWGALLNGGSVAIHPAGIPEPRALGEFVRRHGVTTAWLTAGLFHQVVDAGAEGFGEVRRLLAGGDVLSPPHVARAMELLPRTRLIDGYGPTEATTFTCCHAVRAEDVERGTIPIGPPLANTRVYVLDPAMRPVPVGAPGELYAGGLGLARGYLGRPGMTAEKFVPDPFSADPGGRLYRTGDRARWNERGEIEFLGRIDGQVKLRGFRIEPGEIEAVLRAHPAVRDAAVVMRGEGELRRLVAYVVGGSTAGGAIDGHRFDGTIDGDTIDRNVVDGRSISGDAIDRNVVDGGAIDGNRINGDTIDQSATGGSAIDVDALRAHLSAHLPEYMVPSAFVVLDALPLTPNGKVDRRALPEPEAAVAAEGRAPLSPAEELLAGLWREVLGVAAVGADDDFFLLGGHSLLATRLVSRVRAVFGAEVPLRVVFEAPTLRAMAAGIEALRAGDAAAVAPPIEPAPRDRPLPLSYGQERLWTMEQMAPGALAYGVGIVFGFAGEMDEALLSRALSEVVRRHEALRTVFRAGDSGAEQVIQPPFVVPILVDDLRALPADEQYAALLRVQSREATTPMDLVRGPIVRARLGRLEDTSALVLTIHHAAFDGWSVRVMEHELRALVDAFSRGLPSPLPDLPVQYADFAAWQRRWMASGVLDAQVDFWRGALAGAPATLDLPADRPRPAARTHQGARQYFHLPAETVDAARKLGQREGATLFMVLLAAFDVLMARLSGSDDVVVGTQTAGRTREETEALIGIFVNGLALRTDLSGDPTFREALARVRRTTLDAFAHQDVPFQTLVDALGVARTLSHPPVYNVSFLLQTSGFAAAGPSAGAHVPHLPAGPVPHAAETELTFDLTETGGGIVGMATYSTEIFDHDTAASFVARYGRLLASLLAAPEARLSTHEVADEAERRLVLETWSGPSADFEPVPSAHALVARRAAEAPESVAVVFEEREMSYAELDARAGRLAAMLRALGVGPESRVAVSMERGMEVPVAVLGVLKAGAAYVPIDPAYPAERIEWMLTDSAAAVVLTQERVIERLPSTDARIVAVDREWERLGSIDLDPISVDVHPLNAAYVIYTSGSTGRPKGVVVPHETMLNLVRAVVARFGITARDRFLQFASLSFDKSVKEIFATWAAGAALVLRPEELAGGGDFSRWVEARGITVTDFPTAFWNEWVRDLAESGGSVPATIRLCCFGGEKARPDAVAHWRRLGRGIPLLNSYGPTETTVTTTKHDVRPDADPRADVPIGRPLANVRAYVLDAGMRPVPAGVPGELFIGGAGVARGYLGRPGITAERFVPDPFSSGAGARLYRSGDRVRWRRDGELDFLGRMDAQVKVRGFRIEPGEIEIALRAHAEVRDAVVIAREDGGHAARLVAYVVPADGAQVDANALRGHLADRLPPYMVPSAFVAIERIPVAPGGKVDRRALPAPSLEVVKVGVSDLPRTPVEETLAAVWAMALGVESVGIHDNFFALGGDSILAIQVVSRSTRAGVRITARQLFQHQTVAELARHAETIAGVEIAAEPQGPVVGPAPLLPIQRRFFAREVADAHHWNMSVMGVAAGVDAAALERAVSSILAHHDALRLRFARVDGEWTQHFAPPEAVAPFEVVDFGAYAGDALSRVIEAHAAEVQSSLDLESGPLTRAVLYRGGEGELDRLLWVVHHLAVDGVSWRVLLEDLATAYAQASSGASIVLPPKTASYRRWAERMAAWASSAEAKAEAEWWIGQRWDRAAVLPSSVDAADDANLEADARSVSLELDEETTRALLQDVPPVYGTQVNDALLAALARALSGWTGGRAAAVTLEGHGREELFEGVDVSRTVGWFTSVFPVLLDASAEDVGALLRGTKETLRALPHRGVGFGALRWLSVDEGVRDRLAAVPTPEVVFNYLGQFGGGGEGEGGWLGGARESAGPEHSPRAARSAAVDVLASVAGGRLRVTWQYAGRRFSSSDIERAAAAYVEALREIVAHCRESAGGYTPSDFPLAAVDQPTLDRVLAEVGAGARGTVDDVYPLTPLQEGILFHAPEAEGETDVYVEVMRFPLRGPLDDDALVRAWRALVERTPTFRTAFSRRAAERPLQVVLRVAEPEIARLDWRGASAEEVETRMAALMEGERTRGFRVERAPLLRVALARTGEDAWEMVWSHHHLQMDGWSLPRMSEDLSELFTAFSEARAPRLRERRPFRDHVAWTLSRDADAAEAFWRGELAGFEGSPPMPIGRTAAGAPRVFMEARTRLSRAAAERLRARAAAAGLTPTTLFQGALAVLLSRYTGADDVAFGNTVSGRSPELEGVEEMIGMMINTLPVRARVPSELSTSQWLRDFQARQADARQYDFAPLARMRGWAGMDGGRELFETMFVYESYPIPNQPAADVAAEAADEPEVVEEDGPPRERTNYPLGFAVAPSPFGMEVRLGYDAERFDAVSMRRLMRHYLALVDALSTAGDTPLHALPMLSAEEERVVVREWNGTDAEAEIAPLHRLFEARAARAPEATAIEFGGESIGYGELNARANRLARRLVAMGVGLESIVAISLERSPEMVVALLAVNKAGGAFLPVDPAYPAERRRWMLEDSGARVVVTHSSLVPDLPRTDAVVLAVDAMAGEIDREDDANLPVEVDPEGAAYVIFTSGSTGRPKGVVVPHRGIGNMGAVVGEMFGISPASRMLQFASFSFDASLGEMVPTLLGGGTLVMADPERMAGPELLSILRDEEISIAVLPPSLLAALPDADLPALRTLVSAGEAVSPEVVRRWGAGRRFANGYGPTENTVAASASVDPAPAEGRVPIGRPFRNVRAYVLDPAMRPVPAGVPGEMYVGGIQLARGYLGRPGLTADRFVPDPFSGDAGARLYRTGDRVRWRECESARVRECEGTDVEDCERTPIIDESQRTFALSHSRTAVLEFLGRVDSQVKVRGFRVETGEVESVLLEHPAVREAVVVARGEGDSRRLVAYAAASGDARPTAAELKAHVSSLLLDHMVPSAFVVLDAFPLTPNGKIDRRALPDPDLGADEDRAAPRTPTEEILAGIWGELLGIDRVGADGEFFALGGHSLLATRLVSKIREAFGVEMAIRTIFEDSVLSALAARVDEALRADDSVRLPPLLPREGGADAPLSFSQERLWLLQRLTPRSPAYKVPVVLRFGGALDAGVMERAVGEIVRRHHVLRTIIVQEAAGPVQRVMPADFHLPLHDLSSLPADEAEAEARRLVQREWDTPFEIEGGPLFRPILVRIAADDHVLHLTAHHTVFDGWSAGVFQRELAALYDAFAKGEPSPLADLPVQYADYAAWQRGWMTDEAAGRQAAYWRDRLEGAPPLLELPTDRPRPAVQGYRAGMEQSAIAPGLMAGVRALARREGATPFMVLLAALDVVLSRWSGQEDLVIGTQVAGRTHAGTEPLIGVFLNTLAIRADLSGAPSFRELLARVREATLGAYAHQDVPFERVLDSLRLPRSLGHSPVFQVMVNYQSFGGASPVPAGLEPRPFGGTAPTSKVDMTLYAGEGPQGIGLALVYSAELFDAPRMRELLAQTAAVLEQAVGDADRPVAEMPLRTIEAAAILPDPTEPLDRTWRGSVPEIFARRAAERPNALAVADPLERWTYAELDAATARIARRLTDGGVRPGDTVVIWAHRSAAMVRAMMGVLRAGAAFVALDPAYPSARLAEYVRIAAPRGFVRITAAGPVPAEVEEALVETATVAVEVGSKSADGIDGVDGWGSMSPTARAVEIGPDSLAYLSFTSGTTGAPKAVMGRHGSLTHFTPWLAERFALTASDRFSLLSGLAHDPLHRDVFTPLQLGASIIAPDPAGVGTPGYLGRWMADAEVTVAHLTPAMGQLLADTSDLADDADAAGSMPKLRRAFFVGDVLVRGDVARLHRLAPNVTVVNYYGSTETQRAVSHHVVDPAAADTAKPIVPLGRGIPGVQLLVRTANGGLAGIGELGEVWLRSPHVALGYRGDADLTAARFVPNPWTDEPGDAMYRTGDLGRYGPDGEVEPAGRADQQVKVRGFRIEPGEVETALAKHTAVREAIVMARGEGDSKRLIAWLTSTGERPATREMRDHLRALLPDFMVPSDFVWLDALPLTPNGKVDRRALPDPQAPATAAPVAPRTPTEEAIAGIWMEVLRVESVGVEDDFFVLGGHSLRATQVLARISQRLEVELPLRVLFETPTVAGLAAEVEARRAAGGMAETGAGGEPEVAPLTPTQARLWVLAALAETEIPHAVTALRLDGPVRADALSRAAAALARRHPALRTRVEVRAGEPVRVILPPAPVQLSVEEAEGGLADAVRRVVEEEAARPFAEGEPLSRFRLLRAGGEHALVWTAHFLATGDATVADLAGELAALHGAVLRGEPLPPPPAPADPAAALAYWSARLAGAPERLELPADRPRPPVQRLGAAVETASLPLALLASLRALAADESVAPSLVLLAALDVVLARWAGHDDVVVGMRPPGAAHLAALRADLSGAPSFRGLLGRLGRAADEARGADVPFGRVLEALDPPAAPGHAPLFQARLGYAEAADGAAIFPLALAAPAAGMDLALDAVETREGLALALAYDPALFDAARMRALLAQLGAVLEQAAADPGRPVHSLSLRTAGAADLLPDPARPLAPEPWSGAVHQSFAARAAASPAALAVVDPTERWTYAELDAASSRVAHRLIAAGVRPGDVVAVWAHRSAALPRALLGAWKAGAAFVVLDPEYPAARLARLAEVARPAAVLRVAAAGPVPPEVAAALGGAARATFALGARGADDVGDAPAGAPAVAVGPDDLAYLAFTSGTTGEPKAVAGTHRPLAHFFGWYARALDAGAGDRFSLLAGLAHDPLLRDVFAPLVAGGTLVIPDPEEIATPGWLAEWMERTGVTVAHLTPATGDLLTAAGDAAALPALRLACFGGDVLRAGDVARLRRIAPGVRAVNFYGATETPQAMAAFPVPRELERTGGAIPVGRGIDGVDLLVVAPSGVPAGVGELGEIVVRTPYLSAGYRNDAALTALRFVANPWTGDEADRMYRTGDLGRHRPDGVVELAGRADTQVKVRGFRVELAAVEAALAEHPAVREAVAQPRREGGRERLVAWLTASGERPSSAALREHLGARLPAYMVPSAFVWLDALPLTPNRKVDRRALPDPRPSVPAAPVAPRTPTEEVVAAAWAEELGRETVGVEDDLFQLGGRWGTAIRVAARVSRALEVEVSLPVLFETRTVAALAAYVEAADAGALADALAELEGLSDEEVAALLAEAGDEA